MNNTQILQVFSDIAELKITVHYLLIFVGATMVPVWVGAFTQLWKASKVAKFLEGENET